VLGFTVAVPVRVPSEFRSVRACCLLCCRRRVGRSGLRLLRSTSLSFERHRVCVRCSLSGLRCRSWYVGVVRRLFCRRRASARCCHQLLRRARVYCRSASACAVRIPFCASTLPVVLSSPSRSQRLGSLERHRVCVRCSLSGLRCRSWYVGVVRRLFCRRRASARCCHRVCVRCSLSGLRCSGTLRETTCRRRASARCCHQLLRRAQSQPVRVPSEFRSVRACCLLCCRRRVGRSGLGLLSGTVCVSAVLFPVCAAGRGTLAW
jgi:hypothetical protein